MPYLTNYLTYPFKEQPGAVYVPRVRVKTCHAERRLVSALWQIDRMLVTRSSLKPSRGIVVNDVDLACLYILVESDFLLGGDEDLTVIHVLTPHRLDILRYLAFTVHSPYERCSERAEIRFPVHMSGETVSCANAKGTHVQLTSTIW